MFNKGHQHQDNTGSQRIARATNLRPPLGATPSVFGASMYSGPVTARRLPLDTPGRGGLVGTGDI